MYIILFVSILCLSSKTLATYEINADKFLTGLKDVSPRTISDIENVLDDYGYPFENHELITDDGYILSLHRIPHGKNEDSGTGTKPAVLIMHGLCSSAVDFFILGPDHSLALMLADQGYDVWLGNNRGTTYSRNHTSFDPDADEDFWDFSYHELGIYDDAAIIDHILTVTGTAHISYVGHSQGTTQFFALASTKPEYNEKVNVMVALGPTAYQQNLTHPLIQTIKDFYTIFDLLTGYLNVTEVLPHSTVLSTILTALCDESSGLQEICVGLLFSVVGFDSEQLDRATLPRIFENFPAGNSLKEFKHFLQEVKSGHFRQFDYGVLGNFGKYNQATPPDYNISLITTPVALYYGQNDLLVGIPDVERLANDLPNVVEKHLIEYEKFNHYDFLFGKDVSSMLYFYVVNVLNQHNGIDLITSTTTTTTTFAPTTTRTTASGIASEGTESTTTVSDSTTGNSEVTTPTISTTTASASSLNNFFQICSYTIVLVTIKLII